MKIHKILAAVLGAICLASCEKGIDIITVENTVYFPLHGYSAQTALLGESDYELVLYKAGLNGEGQSDQAATVEIASDATVLDEFKANNPGYEDYVMLPETYYEIESMSYTIPAEAHQTNVRIHLKNIDETFVDTKYLLPIKISGASDGIAINEEQNVVVLHFTRFRNQYEGLHKAYGTAVSETEELKIDKEKTLTSSGTSSVTTLLGNSLTAQMKLTINGNGSVTVSNVDGDNSVTVRNNPEVPSVYVGSFDETYQRSKGTYTLNYIYEENGVEYTVSEEIKFYL